MIWAAGLTILGYFLGHIEFVQKNIDIIAVLIILLSLVPALIEWMRTRREQQAA